MNILLLSFPKDDERKQKWLNNIRKESVPKKAIICSDHFDPGSFQELNGYNYSKRRLKPTALPREETILEVCEKSSENESGNLKRYLCFIFRRGSRIESDYCNHTAAFKH